MFVLRRLVLFNYNSKFSDSIEWTISAYNSRFPEDVLSLEMYQAEIDKVLGR